MKVAQFIGSRELGGAESFFIRLSNSLSNEGVQLESTSVVAKGSKIKSALAGRVCDVRIASPSDPLSRWNTSRCFKALGPDIVQTWMGRATRLIPSKRNFLHVARLGGYYRTKHYRSADYLIGNTRGICEYLVSEGFDSSRVCHISNFVKLETFDSAQQRIALREMLNLAPQTRVIFSMGRLHPNKAFDTLLQAYKELLVTAIHTEDLHLAIAGDGQLKQSLLSLASDLGVEHRVTFLGWRLDVNALMAGADLFVCPSRHEPLGNVILEAWGQRLPVISTATDGAKEVCDTTSALVLVPIDDYQALSEALYDWNSASEQQNRDQADAGYIQLLANHSEEVVVKQYLEFYRSILGN